MRRMRSLAIFGAIFTVAVAASRAPKITSVDGDRCTTIILGKAAGVDGPMTTHTADCSECDFRINKVPAQDHPAGSMRALYEYKGDYPATIASDRGTTWHPDNLEGTVEQKTAWGTVSKITGYIPEVEHTFALFEAGYGIMNEHQVAIGESTCAAKLWAAPTTAGGKAMIEARELTRIALERSRTAREAVETMGALAEKYGFYAADWSGGDDSKGEGGEALTVVDPDEAWVFHVLSDDLGTGAVWAAQRVADDHLAVVANQFIIRQVPSAPRYDFLFSSNLREVAQRAGLWSPDKGEELDFLTTFAPMRSHSNYATRRVWRVFSLVAPSISLPPYTDPYANDYPFSVRVDKPLAYTDVMQLNRDHYEGSQFDLTQGLAAGPYGDPQRFDGTPTGNMTSTDLLQGSFERAISMFRTSYSFVAHARKVPSALSLLWFGQYAPHSSSYVPLYVGGAAPTEFTRGSLFAYDDAIPFWNFLAVNNYASRFFRFAFVDVKDTQAQLQAWSSHAVQALETELLPLLVGSNEANAETARRRVEGSSSSKHAPAPALPAAAVPSDSVGPVGAGGLAVDGTNLASLLTEFSQNQATLVSVTWRKLLPRLITKFHDGYEARDLQGEHIDMHKLFYPQWWLEAVGFFLNKPTVGDGVILFASRDKTAEGTYSLSAGALGAIVVITSLLSTLIGVWVGTKAPWKRRWTYVSL